MISWDLTVLHQTFYATNWSHFLPNTKNGVLWKVNIHLNHHFSSFIQKKKIKNPKMLHESRDVMEPSHDIMGFWKLDLRKANMSRFLNKIGSLTRQLWTIREYGFQSSNPSHVTSLADVWMSARHIQDPSHPQSRTIDFWSFSIKKPKSMSLRIQWDQNWWQLKEKAGRMHCQFGIRFVTCLRSAFHVHAGHPIIKPSWFSIQTSEWAAPVL